MTKRRLALGALAVTSCTPVAVLTDAGTDAGVDAGRDAGTDAGLDAGYDAGMSSDGGCRCATPRADGGCPIPPDFPADAPPVFLNSACQCVPNNDVIFCWDETALRCSSWVCFPCKEDGGLRLAPDGGYECCC